ncbi:uncharacterized protein [Diabrotica undecimpunctata]|uniref:uncharacterized protein n=1 Tax=Diabrotica undecimpunctata TaxID=50387 RepID=UPI003B63DA2F
MVDFSRFAKVLTEIKREFDERFSEFDALKPDLELFNNPMGVNIQNQSAEYQLELCEIQSDSFVQAKKTEDISTFWKSPRIVFLTFITTKTRNRMENDSLEASIRLTTTSIDIDVEKLVEDKPLPQIFH